MRVATVPCKASMSEISTGNQHVRVEPWRDDGTAYTLSGRVPPAIRRAKKEAAAWMDTLGANHRESHEEPEGRYGP